MLNDAITLQITDGYHIINTVIHLTITASVSILFFLLICMCGRPSPWHIRLAIPQCDNFGNIFTRINLNVGNFMSCISHKRLAAMNACGVRCTLLSLLLFFILYIFYAGKRQSNVGYQYRDTSEQRRPNKADQHTFANHCTQY